MKNKLSYYYKLKEDQINAMWLNGILVFDANILLNLYKYSTKTQNKLFQILQEKRNQIWIPYQFAEEYHKNRLNVIYDQETEYEKFINYLSEYSTKLSGKSSHPFLETPESNLNKMNRIVKKIKKQVDDFKKDNEKWFEKDPILEKITSLFDGKVGDQYDGKKIKDIQNRRGPARYKKSVPPGYKDVRKDYNRYGDLIGWYQIIDMACEKNKDVILISEEKKGDWWNIKNEDIIGPRYELIKEIKNKAGVCFHMYTLDEFLKHAKIDADTIQEVKDVSEKNRIIESALTSNIGENIAPFINEIFESDTAVTHLDDYYEDAPSNTFTAEGKKENKIKR